MKTPTLQKRHFEFIAATLKTRAVAVNAYPNQAQSVCGLYEVRRLAEAFADECASTNPQFDRLRFLRACGVEA